MRSRLALLSLAASISISVSVLAFATACAPADAGEAERRPFNNFALETFDGDSLTLGDLEGKVSLVIFWASWCPACQLEMPLLDSLHAAVSHPDFQIVAINDEWNEGTARGYAAAKGFRMPLLLGRGDMWSTYEYFGLPYLVLVDREGRVVEEYYGYPGRQGFDTRVAGRAMTELGISRPIGAD
jgi:thiol-disulfide isomerase/thioredoxin